MVGERSRFGVRAKVVVGLQLELARVGVTARVVIGLGLTREPGLYSWG